MAVNRRDHIGELGTYSSEDLKGEVLVSCSRHFGSRLAREKRTRIAMTLVSCDHSPWDSLLLTDLATVSHCGNGKHVSGSRNTRNRPN